MTITTCSRPLYGSPEEPRPSAENCLLLTYRTPSHSDPPYRCARLGLVRTKAGLAWVLKERHPNSQNGCHRFPFIGLGLMYSCANHGYP